MMCWRFGRRGDKDQCCVSGVDVVLNSLAEEKLQASIRCLARHGRFLEIGKYDLSNNSPLGESRVFTPFIVQTFFLC